MSNKNGTINVVEEEMEEKEANRFLASARNVLLAGIGAAALAQEEVEEFVNKLISRGEIAEQDGRRLINEVTEKRTSRARDAAKKAEDSVEKRVEDLLARMNIPTKKDVESLNRKLNTLNRKIDELKKAQKETA
ncbi:MAG TPA: phasin family protein [Anaerolineae bacterium]|nr:phasin family protein [Anaerolineae bacterium]